MTTDIINFIGIAVGVIVVTRMVQSPVSGVPTIQHKSTGFYNLIEFAAENNAVAVLETEFRRDESVMRFLTTVLDKFAVEYNTRRRKGEFNKNKDKKQPAKRVTEGQAA